MLNLKIYPILAGLLVFAIPFLPEYSFGDDGDTTLYQFVSALVASHPEVKASYEAIRSAEANAISAGRPLYNPELSIEAENSEEQTRTIGLNQTIDWTRKNKSQGLIASAEQEIAEATYELTRLEVTVDLLRSLAAFDLGSEREQLAEERAALMDDFAEIARSRFNAGDLTSVEMNLASLSVTEAKLQKANALASRSEAQQGVLSFLPPSTNGWPKLAKSFPAPPGVSEEIDDLPENVVARLQVRRADEEVYLRKKERKPDPTFGLVGGKEGDEDLVALSFSMPLHIRNNFSAEVAAALARREQTKQQRALVRRHTTTRLRTARTRYQISYEAWSEWEDVGLTSLAEQRSEITRLWESGELSTTDYLVQLRQTLDVQETALELRLELWESWFEWLRASGHVDAWLRGEI